MSSREIRRVGLWLPAWAVLLVGMTALAAWDDPPVSLHAHLAAGRLAAGAGLALLVAVALVLPLRAGGPRRLLEDLLLTLLLALPFAVAAWDWTPLTASRAGTFGLLLASQALLALAASWAGAGRTGPVAAAYVATMVLLLLGAPFLSYLLAETTPLREGSVRYASSVWAARPLLLDREPTVSSGHATPAVAVQLALAAGFAAWALLGQRRRT